MKNKKAFTLSCKTFSSDSSQAKLTQPPAQSSQTKFRSRAAHSYGFTLVETLIVLVILGVVAAITVPALVNRHMEAERRTKLRKAMTAYEAALNKMVIENGIKSDTALTNWADSNTKNDCANTSAYFKASRNLEINGNATNCKFRASDGVFWDISDIKKPLVALREQDLNAETAQSDTNRAFYMFGWFDENGSLRTNDLGKITGDDKIQLAKLYDFINGKTKTSLADIVSIDNRIPSCKDSFCKYKKGDFDSACSNGLRKSCTWIEDAHTEYSERPMHVYDEFGNEIIYFDDYQNPIGTSFYNYDENNTLISEGNNCDQISLTDCMGEYSYIYANGERLVSRDCGSPNDCTFFSYNDNNKKISQKISCNRDASDCFIIEEYDDDGETLKLTKNSCTSTDNGETYSCEYCENADGDSIVCP